VRAVEDRVVVALREIDYDLVVLSLGGVILL